MAQPSQLPEWNSGGSNQTEPTSGKKILGWVSGENVNSSWFNWWMSRVYLWVLYLQGLTNEALTWLALQTFARGIVVTRNTNGAAITATGNGSGAGIQATGGNTIAIGVVGTGGATGGNGVQGQAVGTNRTGVSGTNGITGGQGVSGTAVLGSDGHGVRGTGDGFGHGGIFTGGEYGYGVLTAATLGLAGVRSTTNTSAPAIEAVSRGFGVALSAVAELGATQSALRAESKVDGAASAVFIGAGYDNNPAIFTPGPGLMATGGHDASATVAREGVLAVGGNGAGGYGLVAVAGDGEAAIKADGTASLFSLSALGGAQFSSLGTRPGIYATGNTFSYGVQAFANGWAAIKAHRGDTTVGTVLEAHGSLNFGFATDPDISTGSRNQFYRRHFPKAQVHIRCNGTSAPTLLFGNGIVSVVQFTAGGSNGQITVNLTNSMANLNYFVKVYPQIGADLIGLPATFASVSSFPITVSDVLTPATPLTAAALNGHAFLIEVIGDQL